MLLVASWLLATPAWADPGPLEPAPAGEGGPVAPVPDPAPPPPEEPVPAEPAARKPKLAVSKVFTNDLELRYWQVPQQLPGFLDLRVLDYVELVDRFTANIRAGWFTLYGQFDHVSLFANTYQLDDVRYVERELLSPGLWSVLVPGGYDPATQGTEGWDLASRNAYLTLEKLRFGYDKGNLAVLVGDSYASFGRGIVLDVDRNVDIDLDTSVQGLKVVWRPGAWDVTGVFGFVNRQQVFQDNPNLSIPGERRHWIGGVRLDRFGLGPANLGAHAMMSTFTDTVGWEAGFENVGTTPDVVAAGGSLELLGLGPTDWFVEADGFAYPTDDAWGGQDPRPGYAIYASGAIYGGRTTWLVEFKRYADSQWVNNLVTPELYQVAIPPTLEFERAITEDSAAAVGSNDMWGGRVRMDWSAIPGLLVPYWSVGVFRDEDDSPLHFNPTPETIVHPMVGLEYTGADGWSVLFDLGHRTDLRDAGTDGTSYGSDNQLHGVLTLRAPLPKELSLDLNVQGEWFRWGVNAIQQSDYTEWETSISLAWRNKVTLTWFTDVTTNPLINTTGNLSDLVYGAAELQIRPIPQLTVRIFYGAYKAGIRCSGGQCRVLPGFEGGRLAVTTTF